MRKITPFILASIFALGVLVSPGILSKEGTGGTAQAHIFKKDKKDAPVKKSMKYGDRGNWNRGGGGWNRGPRVVIRNQGPDLGTTILGGLAGFFIGRATAPEAPPPPPPPPPYSPPPPEAVIIEPWTAEWYDYCNSKYRSFNAKTGYYLGYDGREHFCR